MLGLALSNGIGSVDDLSVKSYNTSSSSFDVTEHVETFDIDGNGRSANDPAHDLAGNLTFDGTAKFTYDGWNRLVKVAHAYRDGSNNVQSGQASATMSYDGRGRRITKAITNAGQWDATYDYYYDTDSLIETRNGSNIPVKQHVWGPRYVDELVQVTTIESGEGPPTSTYYWACQDSNYNVLGVVDSSALLTERYEYKPYGERTVFFSPGSNDVGCFAPTQASRRVVQSGADQPFGLVYNRARMLHPAMGRFMQRDPLGYLDGLSAYQYLKSQPQFQLDPTGETSFSFKSTCCVRRNGVVISLCRIRGVCYDCEAVHTQSEFENLANNIGDQCCLAFGLSCMLYAECYTECYLSRLETAAHCQWCPAWSSYP